MLGLRIQAEWGPSFGTGVAPYNSALLQKQNPSKQPIVGFTVLAGVVKVKIQALAALGLGRRLSLSSSLTPYSSALGIPTQEVGLTRRDGPSGFQEVQ